jgi:hypothetical protein
MGQYTDRIQELTEALIICHQALMVAKKRAKGDALTTFAISNAEHRARKVLGK